MRKMTAADAKSSKAEKRNTTSVGGNMAYNRKKPERENNYFTFHLIEKRGPGERSRKSYFYLGHHKPNASCICNDIQISNVGLMPSTTEAVYAKNLSRFSTCTS